MDEDVLASGLQRFNDRLGDLGIRGEDHPDSLRSLEQLDHDGSTAGAVDRWQHVGPVAYERRGRDGDVVSGEDLNRPELSREFAMPLEGVGVYTSICSNWRTTASPKNVIDAPMRGRTASKSSS